MEGRDRTGLSVTCCILFWRPKRLAAATSMSLSSVAVSSDLQSEPTTGCRNSWLQSSDCEPKVGCSLQWRGCSQRGMQVSRTHQEAAQPPPSVCLNAAGYLQHHSHCDVVGTPISGSLPISGLHCDAPV